MGWQLWLHLKEPLFINFLHSQPTKGEAAEHGVTGRLPGGGVIDPKARSGGFEHVLGTLALGLSHWSCCAAPPGGGLLGAHGTPRHPAGSPSPGPPGLPHVGSRTGSWCWILWPGAGSWSYPMSGTSGDHIPQSPTFLVTSAPKHRGPPARPRQEGAFWAAWERAGPQGCGSPSHLGFFTETTAFWVSVRGPTTTPDPHTIFGAEGHIKKNAINRPYFRFKVSAHMPSPSPL